MDSRKYIEVREYFMKQKCDFFECPDVICDEDEKIEQGMRFCQKHFD